MVAGVVGATAFGTYLKRNPHLLKPIAVFIQDRLNEKGVGSNMLNHIIDPKKAEGLHLAGEGLHFAGEGYLPPAGKGLKLAGDRRPYKYGRGKRKSRGTREQVWNGDALMTSGGLTKKDLMISKKGRIVSRKKSAVGKKLYKHIKS